MSYVYKLKWPERMNTTLHRVKSIWNRLLATLFLLLPILIINKDEIKEKESNVYIQPI